MKKKALMTASAILVIAITICYMFFIDHRLHDRSKPNIFEIPGTELITDQVNGTNHIRYFMVQELPESQSEIQSMINEYIKGNDIVRESFSDGIDNVYLYFYTPSIDFPVFFEEDNNYFKMDDFISHYNKNNFLRIRFDYVSSRGDYLFYDR